MRNRVWLRCAGTSCRCEACGKSIQRPPGMDGVQIPHLCDGRPSAGLGDMVAAGLEAVGITKDRVGAVARRIGIKDCGCRQRQQRLNAIGRKLGIGR